MYVKRNASKPSPEPSKEKKNLPKFEVVSKSTVLWKGPNISTHFASMISIPLAYFSPVLHVEDTSQPLWIFCTIQKKYLISQKVLCVTNSKFRNLKKAILYSLLFNIWYTILCVCFVCSMFARKEVLFSVSMFLHIDVSHWCHSQRGSCHPWKKWLKGRTNPVPNDEKPISKKTSFTLNIE